MKEIKLSGKYALGRVALVDDEDFDLVKQYSWRVLKHKSNTYAVAHVGPKTVLLHRFIMKPEGKLIVDHKDGDTLNCQKWNMRLCTRPQNNKNSSKRRTKKIGQYKGVHYWPQWNKRAINPNKPWQARIVVDRKTIELGLFEREDDAARAYDAAAKVYFGEFARCNFPEQKAA